jgi:hypothetical protein
MQELEDGRTVLEQANEELRRKLRTVMDHVNRLQREIDLNQTSDITPGPGDPPHPVPDDGRAALAKSNLPEKPLISAETVMDSSQPMQLRRRTLSNQVDPALYIQVHHKLSNVSDKLFDFVQRNSSHLVVALNDVSRRTLTRSSCRE